MDAYIFTVTCYKVREDGSSYEVWKVTTYYQQYPSLAQMLKAKQMETVISCVGQDAVMQELQQMHVGYLGISDASRSVWFTYGVQEICILGPEELEA